MIPIYNVVTPRGTETRTAMADLAMARMDSLSAGTRPTGVRRVAARLAAMTGRRGLAGGRARA
ncbi:hypothetical protein [Histidinibacterium aquaticum]|uniref:Uncharacterized protein n=1 Tax=Histidinibacterium aquaticum TaxID=2613962 RepID=A0A5J5GSJ6_9RHOB|nr:hypothetical protein [Histidinibacterium aquaticum]KAA9010322.1 hypothetical protein F3S47_03490 [Histidinibacterium aquaticum]